MYALYSTNYYLLALKWVYSHLRLFKFCQKLRIFILIAHSSKDRETVRGCRRRSWAEPRAPAELAVVGRSPGTSGTSSGSRFRSVASDGPVSDPGSRGSSGWCCRCWFQSFCFGVFWRHCLHTNELLKSDFKFDLNWADELFLSKSKVSLSVTVLCCRSCFMRQFIIMAHFGMMASDNNSTSLNFFAERIRF